MLLRGQDTLGTRIYKKKTFLWLMYCHFLDRPNKVYIFIKLRGFCFQFQQEKRIYLLLIRFVTNTSGVMTM